MKRIRYDKYLKKDYIKLKNEINLINPDIIIVSHYELLNAIPKKYLKNTINHYHTNFEQVLKNKSQKRIFNKYKNKIKKFVWLTKETYNAAIKFGITNSVYIYNPLPEKEVTVFDNYENKLIFLARFSKEKRLKLAMEIFNNIIKDNEFKDWKLDLYLVGTLDEETKEKIDKSTNINYMGSTNTPENILGKYYAMIMTSSFEGFPLTVLEANICKTPVIAFEFGESAKEVINEKTGILVKQDNIEEYEKKLKLLMKDRGLRNKLSKCAKLFAESFKIDKIKENWYEIF